MGNSIDDIITLNSQINEAYLEENFSRILQLDTRRREIIQSLATNPEFKSDEKSLNILKDTAEKNHVLIGHITEKMSELTKLTSGKIKMLRSYRQAS